VTFASCQMEWCESVRVSAVNDFKHFVFSSEVLLGKSEYFNDLVTLALIYFGPVVHLHFLHILLSLSLLTALM
jgi:hypothetical protein